MVTSSTGSPLHRALQKFETTIGLVCALLIAILVLAAGAMTMISARGRQPDSYFTLKMSLGCAAMVFESIFLCLMSDAWKQRRIPFAPNFALYFGRWPLILRPIAAGWWAAHFLIGITIALVIEFAIARSPGPSNGLLVQILVFFVISFTLAYAFNLYAMLTLTALGAGEKLVATAWRFRFLLDFAIAIAASAIAIFGRR